jgi:hypothetical protein
MWFPVVKDKKRALAFTVHTRERRYVAFEKAVVTSD